MQDLDQLLPNCEKILLRPCSKDDTSVGIGSRKMALQLSGVLGGVAVSGFSLFGLYRSGILLVQTFFWCSWLFRVMSPSSLDAMEEIDALEERLSEEPRMEVRVDEAVTKPAYVEHALPGQGALLAPLLAPAIQTTQRADAMPSVFQTADQQRDPASRVSGEMSSGPGPRHESEAMPLSAPLLREHTLGRVQAERMGSVNAHSVLNCQVQSRAGAPLLFSSGMLRSNEVCRMLRNAS